MANYLPIKEWKHIFLDTSVIIDFLKSPEHFEKNPPEKERIILVKRLIKAIYEVSASDGKRPTFYVSAVTVAELRKLDSRGAVRDVVRLFAGSDVIFVDFTKTVADKLNSNIKNYLSDQEGKQFEARLKKLVKENITPNVRHWVSDDMKICACASSLRRVDIILTTDKTTFAPIAQRFELSCLPVYAEFIPQDLFGGIQMDTSIAKTAASKPLKSPMKAK